LEDYIARMEKYGREVADRARELEAENRRLIIWKWVLAATTLTATTLAIIGFTQ